MSLPAWRYAVVYLACLSPLVPVTDAGVRLSEFMASNVSVLADEDGEFSDWVEIVNDGPGAVDLAGWMLTDDENFDPADPESVWVLPSRSLAAGEMLVVFASGKGRAPAGAGELHASFQLDARGEYLALVAPDGVTVASEFAGGFPEQRSDISYGTGAVAVRDEVFVGGGAAGRFAVGVSGDEWRGGAEPFDDSGWAEVTTAVGFDAGGGPTGFELVDDFEASNLGLLAGQNGWSTSSSNVTIATDPVVAENQVMRQTGDNVRAWKGIAVAEGETATVFFRMRRDGVVNISAGASDVGTPGGSFADFETQVNNQNDGVLNVRDGGGFEAVGAFDDGVWYSVWMVVDNAADEYVVYWKAEGDGAAVRVETGAGEDVFGFRNGVAGNALVNFFARTGNGTTGDWWIDDIYLADGENLGDPVGGGSGLEDFVSAGGNVEAAMHGVSASGALRVGFETGAVPALASLTLRMRYDDGFVAWLNGVEIARRNAPAGLGAGAVATVERPLGEVVVVEEIDVTAFAGALVADGENVLAVQGLNLSAGDGDFLLMPELVGVVSDAVPQRLYFTAPTPGEVNGDGVFGFVEDTRFSVDRGFYEAPVAVEVTTSTPGATVVYTTDGSEPTMTNGTAVAGGVASLVVRTTTVLRAAAFRDGYLATNVDTHSYLFVADVARQGNAPEGYPDTWKGDGGSGSFPADYEMDPEVVDDPAYRDLIDDALLAVPTISIVTDRGNLFDRATGIYQNPQQSGPAWERPVSFEIIQPDGSKGVQVDAGLRVQGGHTRLPSKNPKHSFRLNFRSEYGDAKLRYDLFPEYADAVKEFDQIVLRGAGNQSWLHHNNFLGDNRGRAQYLRDQWGKDTQIAMGHPGTRNTYAHVYLNGIYWGLYNPTERASADFGESYLGGKESDYVALNSGEGIDGVSATRDYTALVRQADRGLTSSAAYEAFAEELDLVAFSDYILLMQYGANLDWDDHNWYCLRNNNGGKWYFIAWDSEFMFIDEDDNILGVNRASKPSRIWNKLMENADYRRLFADRVNLHCANGGLLTPESVRERWDARKAQMYTAIIGESARWGDYRRDVHPVGGPTPRPLYDRDGEWQLEYDRLTTAYFPVRTAKLMAQYRARNFFPDTEAPVFSQHGGAVASGYALTMGDGEVWFTTDGSEPDGSATAQRLSGSVVLDESVTVKARRREGGEWSALTEASFLVGVLADVSNLGISELMYNPAGPDGAEFLELVNLSATETIDLTAVKFSEGVTFEFPQGFRMAPGERVVVVRDRVVFEGVYGDAVRIAGEFQSGTGLDNSGEGLGLVAASGDAIFRFDYNDKGGWPELADSGGYSLVYRGSGDLGDAASWRISVAEGGSPGGIDSVAIPVDPLGDEDGDGVVALLEYFHGTSDLDSGREGGALVGSLDGSGDFLIDVVRAIGADRVTVSFEVLSGRSWEPADDEIEIVGQEVVGGGRVRERYRYVGGAAGPADGELLLRLSVSLR